MNEIKTVFFIVGCPRSGTTAIAKILDYAENSNVFIEQSPKLCIESRHHYERRLENPEVVLKHAKKELINNVVKQGLIYGDKNPNYLPFIPYLEKIWAPKYLFIIRDGRDVVRSLMDWHEFGRGNIFGMNEDNPDSTIVSYEQDWWDYSRLRPRKGEEFYEDWIALSRFEKISWYWNRFNELILESVRTIPKQRYKVVHIEKLDKFQLKEIYTFLDLDFDNYDKPQKMLNERINSVEQRYGAKKLFPDWQNWTDDEYNIFQKYAKNMMEYYKYI